MLLKIQAQPEQTAPFRYSQFVMSELESSPPFPVRPARMKRGRNSVTAGGFINKFSHPRSFGTFFI